MPNEPRASRPSMPGYGLEPADGGEGLLPWSWARQRLATTRNYFFSTTRPDGGPHVMILWGLWLEDTFQFSTGRTSRKARNLEVNPRCVVCPDGADDAVIVEGVASELTDAAMQKAFFAAYEAKYGTDPSSMGEPTFLLRPRVVFGQIEKTFTKSATRWTFG